MNGCIVLVVRSNYVYIEVTLKITGIKVLEVKVYLGILTGIRKTKKF